MLQGISAILADLQPILLNVLSFLAGLILGHLLNVSRIDHRERETRVDAVAKALRSHTHHAHIIHSPAEAEERVEFAARLMTPWKRRRVRRALRAYLDAGRSAMYQDSIGQPMLRDDRVAEVERLRQELLRALR